MLPLAGGALPGLPTYTWYGFAAMVLTTGVATALWVIRDARARGIDLAVMWGLAAVLTPVGLPWYLYSRVLRSEAGTRRTRPERRDRLLGAWASAGIAAMVLGVVLTPPDPLAAAGVALVAFVGLFPMAYLLLD